MSVKGRWRVIRTEGDRAVPRLTTILALGAVCGAALALAACGQFSPAQPGPYYPSLGGVTPTPTVAPLGVTVAAWPSNSGPAAGEPVEIGVTVRNAGVPVSGAAVSLSVGSAGSFAGQLYGPYATDAAGFAGFTLSGAGDQPNHPVLIQVAVSYQGQTYSATTEFTPAP